MPIGEKGKKKVAYPALQEAMSQQDTQKHKGDMGKLLEETAEPFVSMAEYGGREMRVTAEKDLRMTGDRASIQRLISTLCDNAVKYASAGPIEASMRGDGRMIRLEVLGDEEADYRKRTPRNSLERGMFEVWRNGGRFHTTGMFLLREEVSQIGNDPYMT